MPLDKRRRVADIGELAMLARIAERIGPPGEDVILGVGDDTAALWWNPERLVLLTTDALVQDVHFRRATFSASDVGWKVLAINASDIAAMGGTPTHAVVSLMLPADLEADWVDEFYHGLLEMARAAGVTIAGGNLAQAPSVVVDVTLLGTVAPDRLLRRSGARPGDILAVTGTLGRAAAGLLAADMGLPDAKRRLPAPSDDALWARAITAQRRPQPRLAEGRVLASTGAVHAMIDLSDGLELDLWRLCEASSAGVRLHAGRIPIDACVAPIAAAAGRDPLDLASSGGEDYELLFAMGSGDADRVLQHLQDETGTPATIIGHIEDIGAGRIVKIGKEERALSPSGWTHFRSATRRRTAQRRSARHGKRQSR
jgi:thiamine-monophosphate kinase